MTKPQSDTPEVDREEFTHTYMRDGVITGEQEVVDADFARRLERERDEARRQLEEARKDAERYWWLRQPDPLSRGAHIVVLTRGGGWVASGEQADAAIDALLSKERKT